MEKNNGVIAAGISVCGGEITGRVKIIKSAADVHKVESDDIMVVAQSSPAYAIGVMKAAGLICEGGGMLSHVCIVAKEIGIPCLARVEKATELLHEDMSVTLDADRGVIYG